MFGMKGSLFGILLLFVRLSLLAQSPPPLIFNGQPVLEDGISIEPYALYYENPSGDTLQSLSQVARQAFRPIAGTSLTKFSSARQMKQTSQVLWLKFQIRNSSPMDTLHLWYYTGPHALSTLYLNKGTDFSYIGKGGISTIAGNKELGPFAIPMEVLPDATNTYFLRIADYLVVLDKAVSTINTTESYRKILLNEAYNIKWLFFTMAMIIGCLMLISLYAFFQYLLGRDKAYFYYGLFAAIAFLWMLKFASPRLYLHITPSSMPWLEHPLSFSFYHILSLIYALFLTTLLDVPRQQPKLWKFVRALMVLLAVLQLMVIVQFFTGLWTTNIMLYFIVDAIPSATMGVLMVMATLRSRSKLKPYLLVGEISLYVIALSPLHGLFSFPNVPPQMDAMINYPPFFMALGLFSELFFFLLALAYRNKLVEVEKNHLQQNYTRQLESELAQRTEEIKAQSRKLDEQHTAQLQMAFDQKLAEMEMTALRAQMNPHFIFNCLNSIKLYTTDNDSAKASAYLTKFSRLIRLVLENSRSERVTLKNELEALELYLDMEVMRFKDKLKFTIDVVPDLDTDMVEIPPMLIQPYVENAIWHGLMHKKEGGSVQIKVDQPRTNHLHITITDNGIGRKKAASLKSKTATVNKSFGMKVTDERIVLINQMYRTNANVRVNDLMDAEGNAAGTEVMLEIEL